MKPPTRKRATRTKDLHMEEYSRWNLSERQRLLKALEKYPVEQISEIAKLVITKSESEVIYYISKLKRSLKSERATKEGELQTKYMRNLKTWIQFVHQLVDDDEDNYSSMIGKLLALYGDYSFKRKNCTGVNFKLIYDYLAGLLLGMQCPVLPPLESALVLDLLRDSAIFLTQCDTSRHKKCVLMNYKKHMYPDFLSTAESEQMIMSKLLAEDLVPPGLLPALSPSEPHKKIHTKVSSKHQGKLSSDSSPTPANQQSDPDSQSRKPESSSASSLMKRKLPLSWRKESSSSNLASSKAKCFKSLTGIFTSEESQTSKAFNTLNKQNLISEEIPSTSETIKSTKNTEHNLGLNFSVEEEKSNFESQRDLDKPCIASDDIKQELNDVDVCMSDNTIFAPSVSVMHGNSSSVPVTEREIVQYDQDLPSQQSNVGNIQLNIHNNNTNTNQVERKDQISLLSNVMELSHFPSKKASPQVPTGDNVLHSINGGMIKKDKDVNNITSSPSVERSTVRKKTILSSLLENPNESAILERIHQFDFMKASKSSSNQCPKGSSVQKKTVPSNPSGPSRHTVQLKMDNVITLSKSTSILNLQDPSGNIISKKTILSNQQNTNEDIVSNQQTSSEDDFQQRVKFIKVLQVTSKGLVEKGSVPTNRLPVSSNKIKVCQMTNQGPASKDVPAKGSRVAQCVVFSQKDKEEKSSVSVKPESKDTDGDANKLSYKPCVTWLNPIKIPDQLIKLNKARKRISN